MVTERPEGESNRGRFVVLEGVEGAGKSTQARMLGDWLEACGIPFTLTREPGGTEVGEAIRHVVQDRPELSVPPETELLLYLAARTAFVKEVALPVLERGELLISDRFSLSTYAYQGYGRGLDLGEVRRMDRFASGGLAPDIYLVLDLPVEEGRARQKAAAKREDRLESSGEGFLEAVGRGYRELVCTDESVRLVDARGTPLEVHTRVREVLRRELPETFVICED
jgi:dTMP kinase